MLPGPSSQLPEWAIRLSGAHRAGGRNTRMRDAILKQAFANNWRVAIQRLLVVFPDIPLEKKWWGTDDKWSAEEKALMEKILDHPDGVYDFE